MIEVKKLGKHGGTVYRQGAELTDWPFRAVRHILVPTDLTSNCPQNVRYAIHLARHLDSRITLLHVYQPPVPLGNTIRDRTTMDLLKDHRQVEEALKALGTTVRAAYPNCEWILRSGDPGSCIMEAARELGVNLIVVSSHHHHWIDRYRQSNNVNYVLRHAPCPTLTVSDGGEPILSCPD